MTRFKANDMTQGNVSRQLVIYAIPMICASLLQAIYGIVDIIVAGNFIGSYGLSAISNSSLVMNFLTQIAIGFTVGGNVIMGQYYGRKDSIGYKKSSGTLLLFSVFLGLLGLVVFFVLAHPLLVALGAPALEGAVVYLKVCALGMPAVFGYNAVSATLRALGNSKTPLVFILISASTNIILDIVFVAVFHWGVFGAAFATIISQYICFLASLAYSIRYKELLGYEMAYLRVVPEKLKMIFKYGTPIALQMTIGTVSWLAVMVLINKYGVDVSAGNGVSNKIKDLCQLFITATTSASATMVAQNIGAGEYARAEKIMKTCMKMTMLMATSTIVLVEICAPYLVSIFTSDAVVASYAVKNLRIEIIAQIFYAGFMTFNVLATGCGNTKFVMGNSFLNCIIVRLILAVVLERCIGLIGVYIACMVAPSSSVPVGFVYYKQGNWKNEKVV